MRNARVDRATVSLCSAVSWILTGKFDRVPQPAAAGDDRGRGPPAINTPGCLSAEELEARESLLVALRDDDLRSTGRFTNTRAEPMYAAQCGRVWTLHSRWYTKITSAQWLEGTYDWIEDSLDLRDGQFIDVQVPRWTVEAFWLLDPKPPPEVGVAGIADLGYTTPYLQLMQQAIAELGISNDNQPIKDSVVDWFRGQKINGVPLSDNHIRHLATFVRLPNAQKGGNRKW